MGIWLCGGCFKMHNLRSKCRHGKGSDFVSPPDCEDGVVRFVLYDLTKPHVPSSLEQLDHVDDLVQVQHGVLPLCLHETFRPRNNLECKSVIKRQRQEESIVNAIRSWSSPGGSLQVLRETLAESFPHLSDVDEEDIDLGERNIKQCKRKICDGHYTAAIRVLFSSGVSAIMIGHSLDGYLDGLQFGVGVAGGIEAILHSVNRLIEACGDDVGLSMLLVDFKNAFNLEDRESVLSLLLDQDLLTGNGGWPPYVLNLGGLGLYYAGDVLNYAFLASRLQSIGLQTKLLRHTGIVSPGPIFDDALPVFNTSIETDLLSNPKFTFSLSPQQFALWTSQMEDHTSDWLMTVSISGLGQTMNGKTCRCVLCYRLGISLFSVSKHCSRVFSGDVYGDHDVSCARIIGIKHRHNVVRDTLVDICYRSGISSGKEVDIELDVGRDKPLRPPDMLLYSWDGGLDVCVDLTGSSPLKQNGMVDFIPGQAVIDAAQRKRDKYMAKCAAI
uniref:Uncharacterized protein n=1 Tax=Tanacetum cinerariifolium TaxID=118510 RepID=A0A699I3M1_TANCI|nr:hypothetical protein [Tanacetum cinerariifolium]